MDYAKFLFFYKLSLIVYMLNKISTYMFPLYALERCPVGNDARQGDIFPYFPCRILRWQYYRESTAAA